MDGNPSAFFGVMAETELETAYVDTIRRKVLKIGARIVGSVHRISDSLLL